MLNINTRKKRGTKMCYELAICKIKYNKKKRL